jgi:hypothetical protein
MTRFLLVILGSNNFADNRHFSLVKSLFVEMKSDVLKSLISERKVDGPAKRPEGEDSRLGTPL